MEEQDYITPIVGNLIAGAVVITSVVIVNRIQRRWIERKIRLLEEKNLLETKISAP